MTDAELGFTQSLWSATAEEAPETPASSGSIDADVVIVGAGFTGLSVALHLVEPGQSVVVVEAQKTGWGALRAATVDKLTRRLMCCLPVLERTLANSVATGFLSLLMGLVIWCSN